MVPHPGGQGKHKLDLNKNRALSKVAREVAWLLKKVRTGDGYDQNELYETLEELGE